MLEENVYWWSQRKKRIVKVQKAKKRIVKVQKAGGALCVPSLKHMSLIFWTLEPLSLVGLEQPCCYQVGYQWADVAEDYCGLCLVLLFLEINQEQKLKITEMKPCSKKSFSLIKEGKACFILSLSLLICQFLSLQVHIFFFCSKNASYSTLCECFSSCIKN